MTSSTIGRRAVLISAITTGTVLLGAPPASAHVEADAPGAQAGAGPVVVAFTVEAESSTAGITGVKTQLPAGLSPASVSLTTAPQGWALTPTPDGYEIAGPAIGIGVDAEFGVSIDQLPADAATDMPFETLVRYSDGSEDAWIELPTADNPEPQNPAPAITVAPAAASVAPATTSSAPSSSPTPAAASSADAEAEAEAASASEDDGSTTTGLVIGGIVLIAAIAGLVLWSRRRRSSGS